MSNTSNNSNNSFNKSSNDIAYKPKKQQIINENLNFEDALSLINDIKSICGEFELTS